MPSFFLSESEIKYKVPHIELYRFSFLILVSKFIYQNRLHFLEKLGITIKYRWSFNSLEFTKNISFQICFLNSHKLFLGYFLELWYKILNYVPDKKFQVIKFFVIKFRILNALKLPDLKQTQYSDIYKEDSSKVIEISKLLHDAYKKGQLSLTKHRRTQHPSFN